MNKLSKLLFFTLLLLVAHGGWAQKTWIRPSASGPGNWSDPNNWSPVGVPAATDNVTLSGTGRGNCIVDVPSVCRNILQPGGFGITATLILNADLTVSGDWNVAAIKFVANTQKVIFSGTTNTQITSATTFYDLEIRKDVATASLTVPNVVSISNKLILNQGLARFSFGPAAYNNIEVIGGNSSFSYDGSVPAVNRRLTCTTEFEVTSGQFTIPAGLFLDIQGNWTQNGGTVIGNNSIDNTNSAANLASFPVNFTGGTAAILSGTTIDIQAAVLINKTGASSVTFDDPSGPANVGTTTDSKNFIVAEGEFVIDVGAPFRVDGDVSIVNNGTIIANNIGSVLRVGDDFRTDQFDTANGYAPFDRGSGSSVQFVGEGNATLRLCGTNTGGPTTATPYNTDNTIFREVVVQAELGNTKQVTLDASSAPLIALDGLIVGSNSRLILNNVTNNSSNRTASAPCDPLSIAVPDADLYAGFIQISNTGGIDAYSNEPSDANTISVHITGTIQDNNTDYATNSRGFFVSPSNLSGGSSQGDNNRLPTVVFRGTQVQEIRGFTNGLKNRTNQPITGLEGMYLPNVYVAKDIETREVLIQAGKGVRVVGDMRIVIGTFTAPANSTLLYGNRDNDDLDIYGILNIREGCRFGISTGGNSRGAFVKVRRGGLLKLIGSSSARVAVDRDGTPGQYYRIEAQPGGMIEAVFTNFTFQGSTDNGFLDDGGARSDGGLKMHFGSILNPRNGAGYDPVAGINTLYPLQNDPLDVDGDGNTGLDDVPSYTPVDPNGTPADGDEFPIYHNFSFCSYAQGATGYTGITVNTGQTLTMMGTRFTGSCCITQDNNIVASPAESADAMDSNNDGTLDEHGLPCVSIATCDVDPALDGCGVITMIFSEGAIGGVNGEGWDGGSNDTNTPSTDRIVWENYNPMYWVGNYSGSGFGDRDPDEADGDANADGGTDQPSETYTGSDTEWTNWKNWSLRNDEFYNPGQVYPGQTTAPFAGTYLRDWPGDPLDGTVPPDTLQQYDAFICKTAPTQPTIAADLELFGSFIVNSGVSQGSNASTGGIFGERLRRMDIIPQNTSAPDKRLTIDGTTIVTTRSSVIVENGVNGGDADLFAAGAATVNIGQNVGIENNATIDFSDAATEALLVMNGPGEQEFKFNNGGEDDLENLTIDKVTGQVIMQGGGQEMNVFDFVMERPDGSAEFRLSTGTRLTTRDDVTLNGGTFIFDNSRVTVGDSWINTGGFVSDQILNVNAEVRFRASDASIINHTVTTRGQVFPEVFFQNGAGGSDHTYTITDNMRALQLTYIQNTAIVRTQTGDAVSLGLDGLRIENGGRLDLEAGAELLIQTGATSGSGTNSIEVEPNGYFEAIGTQDQYVKLSRLGTGYYTFDVNGFISMRFYNVQFTDVNGIDMREGINQSPGITLFGGGCPVVAVGNFSDGTLTNGEDVADATYIYLPPTYRSQEIYNLNFPLAFTAANTSNIRRENAQGDNATTYVLTTDDPPVGVIPGDTSNTQYDKVLVINATGVFSGEAYDRETAAPGQFTSGGADSVIVWSGQIRKWDGGAGTNAWSDPANWVGDAVPSNGDAVFLDHEFVAGAYTVELGGAYAGTPATVRDLTINSDAFGANPAAAITLNLVDGGKLDIQRQSPCPGGVEFGGDFSASQLSVMEVYDRGASPTPSLLTIGKGWSNAGTFSYDAEGNGVDLVNVVFNQPVGSRVITTGPSFSPFWNVEFQGGYSENNDALIIDNDFTLVETSGNTPIFDASDVENITITVGGDWENDRGQFIPRAGTVIFNGLADQMLTKTGPDAGSTLDDVETFYNLELDKFALEETAPGNPNELELASRVLVTNEVLFKGGIITTREDQELIIGEAGSWVRETSPIPNLGYVDGPVGRVFRGSVTLGIPQLYPIGAYPQPYDGGDIGAGADGFGFSTRLTNNNPTTFTMEIVFNDAEDQDGDGLFDNDPNNADPTPDPSADEYFDDFAGTRTLPPSVNMISNDRFWRVRNIGYPTGEKDDVTLVPDMAEAVISLRFESTREVSQATTTVNGNLFTTFNTNADLVTQLSILQDYDATTDAGLRMGPGALNSPLNIRRGRAGEGVEWRDLGGIGDLESEGVTIQSTVNFTTLGNGQFTFGWCFTPLPVDVLNLSAEQVGAEILLTWIVSNEIGLENYRIERSSDGSNFSEIGIVEIAEGGTLKSYEFLDESPLAGINYYRLAYRDAEGQNYSKIVAVNFVAPDNSDVLGDITLYPNPTQGNQYNIKLPEGLQGTAQVRMMDLMGKRIHEQAYNIEGTILRGDTTRDVQPGVYMVQVIAGSKQYQRRLVVL